MPGSNRTSSLVALALLLTGLAVLLAMTPTVRRNPQPPPERPEVGVLRSYVGRDLWFRPDAGLSPLLAALHELDPVRAAELRDEWRRFGRAHESLAQYELERRYWGHYSPQHLWLFGREGAAPGYLVFERTETIIRPGSTGIRLTLFDPNGEVQARAMFTTGWRLYLGTVHLERLPGFEYPVLVLDTGSGFPEIPTPTRQFYALRDGHFGLVWAEDEHGVILATGTPR